jgi:hypothetical protein
MEFMRAAAAFDAAAPSVLKPASPPPATREPESAPAPAPAAEPAPRTYTRQQLKSLYTSAESEARAAHVKRAASWIVEQVLQRALAGFTELSIPQLVEQDPVPKSAMEALQWQQVQQQQMQQHGWQWQQGRQPGWQGAAFAQHEKSVKAAMMSKGGHMAAVQGNLSLGQVDEHTGLVMSAQGPGISVSCVEDVCKAVVEVLPDSRVEHIKANPNTGGRAIILVEWD